MIEFSEVSFAYEAETQILNNISVTIEEGKWIAVIGSNGSGKSTFARLINGLLLPGKGSVMVDGLNTKNVEELQKIRQRVAFVFQNPDNQLVATTVEDDVAFGPENLSLPATEIVKRVEDALRLTGLTQHAKTSVYELSGGEKQRVAIAGALAMASSYIVLDEPTSMLDPLLRKQVLYILKQLHDEMGMGLIYVTNVMEEVYLADQVLVINNGNLAFSGSPSEIFTQREKLQKMGLGIPSAQALCAHLAEEGILSRKDIYEIEVLAEELCK